MNASSPVRSQPDLTVLHAFAQLLERIEQRPLAVTADQYRSVVQRLTQALRDAPSVPEVDALMALSPATAQLYENLHYEHAGLCRSPLEASLNAELRARQIIERARQAARAAKPT